MQPLCVCLTLHYARNIAHGARLHKITHVTRVSYILGKGAGNDRDRLPATVLPTEQAAHGWELVHLERCPAALKDPEDAGRQNLHEGVVRGARLARVGLEHPIGRWGTPAASTHARDHAQRPRYPNQAKRQESAAAPNGPGPRVMSSPEAIAKAAIAPTTADRDGGSAPVRVASA